MTAIEIIKTKNQALLFSAFSLMIFSVLSYFIQNQKAEIKAHIGKLYTDVIKDSTFPIERKTAFYPSTPPEANSTWINSPVTIIFDDPVHGFKLPPTLYGAVSYRKGQVDGISTSPMMEALPFNQTEKLLNELQTLFKTAGWTPQQAEGNDWIKVSTDEEKSQLQHRLFNHADGVILLIPYTYSLLLHIKCHHRCDEKNPETATYLIDLGLGQDFFSD